MSTIVRVHNIDGIQVTTSGDKDECYVDDIICWEGISLVLLLQVEQVRNDMINCTK